MAKRNKKLKPLSKQVVGKLSTIPDDLGQLAISPPPSQRVDDLIVWAKALLARYEPEALAREIE